MLEGELAARCRWRLGHGGFECGVCPEWAAGSLGMSRLAARPLTLGEHAADAFLRARALVQDAFVINPWKALLTGPQGEAFANTIGLAFAPAGLIRSLDHGQHGFALAAAVAQHQFRCPGGGNVQARWCGCLAFWHDWCGLSDARHDWCDLSDAGHDGRGLGDPAGALLGSANRADGQRRNEALIDFDQRSCGLIAGTEPRRRCTS